MSAGDDWPCEAYGLVGIEIGARCFLGNPLGSRVCADAAECSGQMRVQRELVLCRIRMAAAHGDPVMAQMARAFPTSESLLGGSAS